MAIDPLNSIPAIQEAARKKDRKAIPELVKQLDNDDPAIRFYAISALQDITGQTFGYHYFDDKPRRKPAVEKWAEWAAGNATR
jgi:hypothetical protein